MIDHAPFACLSRRRAMILLGMTGAAALARTVVAGAAPLPACVLTPEQTEGPFFVDERLRRADIRSDPADGSMRAGAPLALQLRVSSIGGAGCAPLSGATVDVWHCDAAGIYSDADDMRPRTKGTRFLRGYQVTGEDGIVRFTTIYPGWYPGRAVHIHFKLRAKSASGRDLEFTSQLYFNDALTDRVHARMPYNGQSERRTRNARDGLYRQGGRALQLDVVDAREGYAAAYDVGVTVA